MTLFRLWLSRPREHPTPVCVQVLEQNSLNSNTQHAHSTTPACGTQNFSASYTQAQGLKLYSTVSAALCAPPSPRTMHSTDAQRTGQGGKAARGSPEHATHAGKHWASEQLSQAALFGSRHLAAHACSVHSPSSAQQRAHCAGGGRVGVGSATVEGGRRAGAVRGGLLGAAMEGVRSRVIKGGIGPRRRG